MIGKDAYSASDAIIPADLARRDMLPGMILGLRCWFGDNCTHALEAVKGKYPWAYGKVSGAAECGFLVDMDGDHQGTAYAKCIILEKEDAEPKRVSLMRDFLTGRWKIPRLREEAL